MLTKIQRKLSLIRMKNWIKTNPQEIPVLEETQNGDYKIRKSIANQFGIKINSKLT